MWITGDNYPTYPQGVWISFDTKVGFKRTTSGLTLGVIHLSTPLIIITRRKLSFSYSVVRGRKSKN
jgi:hypothetical protein